MSVTMLRENDVVPFTSKQTNLLFCWVKLKWSQILLFAQILILLGKFLPHYLTFVASSPVSQLLNSIFVIDCLMRLPICWPAGLPFSQLGKLMFHLSEGFFYFYFCKDVDGPVSPVIFALFEAQVSHCLIILSYLSKKKKHEIN